MAHPDLVPVAQQVFDEALGDRPNQLDHRRNDLSVTAADLLALARTPGASTETGLRANISVGIRYVAAWLGGSGAVGIDNLMEDAATAEISRSQIWQWVHAGHRLDDGQQVTRDLVERVLAEECARLEGLPGLEQARALFEQSALDDDFVDFLTLPAYAAVLAAEH